MPDDPLTAAREDGFPEIALIIPAYREAERLPPFLGELCEAIAAEGIGGSVCVMVVDDGSPPDESRRMGEAVEALRRTHRFLEPMHREPTNLGKGGTVYAGWDRWAGVAGIRWLGFVDADGASSAAETVRLMRVATGIDDSSLAGPLPAIYAVRYPAPRGAVRRSATRGLLGRVFSLLTYALFHFPLRDTQCGLKIVPAAAYREVRPTLREMRFCFDIELTHRLLEAGTPIRAVPITWHESPGSSVSLRSAARMFLSLIELRLRLPRLAP